MATTYNISFLGFVFAYLFTTNFARANLFMPPKRIYFCLGVSSEEHLFLKNFSKI